MRTLLVSAGICLTAGTFVAAERFASSGEQARVLEQREVIQAALDAQAEQEDAKFAAKISSLQDKSDRAEAQVAMLTSTVGDLTRTRDDLAAQVAAAQSIRETLTQLEAANLDLVASIEARDASLVAKNAELDALSAQIETLSQSAGNPSEPTPETEELLADVAFLTALLASRDDTIASLRAARAKLAGATASEGGDANPALAEELQAARATIEDLTKAAADQAETAEKSIAAISEVLRERDATVAQLQAELAVRAVAKEIADPTLSDSGASENVAALSERLTELTQLVSTQAQTISNLRMGFDSEPATAMEMASACIDRARKIFEISQIKFGTGTSAISQQSITTLDHLRDLAIGCESDELIIEIGGHTDSLGAESANQALSEARAQSVLDFLVGRGIPAEKMVAVGYGETQPIATNDTQVGRAQNRRITFTWQMREQPADPEETVDNIDG